MWINAGKQAEQRLFLPVFFGQLAPEEREWRNGV